MLAARPALWKQYCRLHDVVVKIVAQRSVLALHGHPGVGPVAVLSFMTAIDDLNRAAGRVSTDKKSRRLWIAISILIAGLVLILLVGLACAVLIQHPAG